MTVIHSYSQPLAYDYRPNSLRDAEALKNHLWGQKNGINSTCQQLIWATGSRNVQLRMPVNSGLLSSPTGCVFTWPLRTSQESSQQAFLSQTLPIQQSTVLCSLASSTANRSQDLMVSIATRAPNFTNAPDTCSKILLPIGSEVLLAIMYRSFREWMFGKTFALQQYSPTLYMLILSSVPRYD